MEIIFSLSPSDKALPVPALLLKFEPPKPFGFAPSEDFCCPQQGEHRAALIARSPPEKG